MNWFTKAQTTFQDLNIDDQCGHLKEGDVCFAHTERDSFGPVGAVALCLDCETARLRASKKSRGAQ